jgi:DNA polymerase III subunit epsilon
MEPVVVIDFETTGLSPEHGARATEIGAVLVRDGRIVDRYQSLMNAGQRIPDFIQSLTGITNSMIRQAPPAGQVMAEVADFVGDYPLIAHNASFDRKFWEAELARIGYPRDQTFVCSMLVARRVLPEAPNHKLGTLVTYAGLPVGGRHHRALADAEMAAHLTLFLERTLVEQFRLGAVSYTLLQRIQRASRSRISECVQGYP